MSRAAEEAYEYAKKHSAPGEGGRFKAMKNLLASEGAKSPGGLAAYIGRKRYGKAKFQKMASAGRR